MSPLPGDSVPNGVMPYEIVWAGKRVAPGRKARTLSLALQPTLAHRFKDGQTHSRGLALAVRIHILQDDF